MRDPGGVGHELEVLKNTLICHCLDVLFILDGRGNGPHADGMFRLRDNLIHRGWSLEWHYQILRDSQVHLEQLLQERRSELAAAPNHYLTERLKLFFLLDDVIFNALSHLDYFASFVQFIISRGQEDEKKWNSLAKTSRDSKNSISRLPVIQEIGRRHRAWIHQLQDFRGRVIHHKSTAASHAPQVDLWSSEPTPPLRVVLPGRLSRSLPVQMTVQRDEATPLHAAAAIVKSTVGDILAILQVLREQDQASDAHEAT
ncbi:MAG: hypothetical protein K2X36_05050 [Microbacteriaceae bacterium]|nr:hypothetical protein [Microbacteriaceae bacterium]